MRLHSVITPFARVFDKDELAYFYHRLLSLVVV